MRKKWLYKAPGILLIVIAAVAIFGYIVQHSVELAYSRDCGMACD